MSDLADRLDKIMVSRDDFDLIVEASTALRELVARVESAESSAMGYAMQVSSLLDERDALKAENAKLRSAMEYATHQMEKGRIWGGTDWDYNPLHPHLYRAALERLREALREGEK